MRPYSIKLLTLAAFLFSASATAMNGNGTSSDPYQITNCTDLQNMNQNLSASYVLANNIDCSDTKNWNNGAGFIPVGPTNTNFFSGTFDGQHHVISNLYINNQSSQSLTGLFGMARWSLSGKPMTISNVSLVNVAITGLGSTGALAGVMYGTISNVSVSGNVTSAGSVGGLVGIATAAGVSISNVGVAGNVSGVNSVGGLVGVLNTGRLNVSNSHATANVTATGSQNVYGGGLVGRAANNGGSISIVNSYTTGDVTAPNASGAGGLVGSINGALSISGSYSSGNIAGAMYVGGLAGLSITGTISNSYATGNVTGNGLYDVGGLVGLFYGTISNSYAVGAVTGLNAVGGLVGMFTGGTISNSYSAGKVTGSGTFVGGLVGGISTPPAQVLNSYYDVDTSGQHDTGKGIPEADAAMEQQSTFQDWDFDNTWAINEGKYYPVMPWDAGKENLYDAQRQLQAYEQMNGYDEAYGTFQGITYNVSDGNSVTVLQTPNIWGQPLASVGYIPWDGKTSDFSDLPDCTNNPGICPANTKCLHLNAFNNGITGQSTKRCVNTADQMVDNIYNVMTSATTSIDITTLEPFPDGRFLAAMRNATTWLAVNNRNVTIRVLGGFRIKGEEPDPDPPEELLRQQVLAGDQNFLQQLVKDIPADKANNINVYVGSMRSCYGLPFNSCLPSNSNKSSKIAYRASWNHSKIIDADGNLSLVGGQNWWTNSYLVNNPIDDMNLEVQGPASLDASNFVNQLWYYTCLGGNKALWSVAISVSWIKGQYGEECLPTIPLPPYAITPKNDASGTTVMGIGRLGAGMYKKKNDGSNVYFKHDEPANQSEVVKNLLFKGAVSTVRIAQQNIQGLAESILFRKAQFERKNDAGNVYKILTKLILQNGDVYIVESNYGAVDGAGESYYTQSKLRDVADKFHNVAAKLVSSSSSSTIWSSSSLKAQLCAHLHLAGIRYSDYKKWPDGNKIGNHSKVWIVDNKAYYVGSHNIYPANLQEYGYIVSGQAQTQSFVDQFWTPLWQYSKQGAISGSEMQNSDCYFNQPDTSATLSCSKETIIQQSPINIIYSGCNSDENNTPAADSDLAFIVGEPGETHVDSLVCATFANGQNVDYWKGCGQGEVGQQDYQVNY